MTAKERVLELVPNWSEQDAEIALRAVAHAHEHDDRVDEWGDLDLMLNNAAADTMRELDEEEIAANGETLGEAWTRLSGERPDEAR